MISLRLFTLVLAIVCIAVMGFSQDRVLIGQYDNPNTFSAANYGGTQSIYFDADQNYLAACAIVDYGVIYSIVSLDGGATWQTSEVINTAADPEVRNPSVRGSANSPVFVFEKRGGTPSSAPWIRHQVFFATDDFGWGGGSYSVTPLGVAGMETDVLDSYISNMEISDFDPNLWAVASAHGSSQVGGEYQQIYVSVDGGQNWADIVKIASSNAADSLNDNYVPDLTYNTADIHFGPDGYIMAAATGQWDFDFQGAEHLWFTYSEDSGKTWSKATLIPGSETIDVNWDVVDRGWNLILDDAGNFHLFALANTTGNDYGAYDFVWDGENWTVQRFVEPQLIENGLVAIEGAFGDTAPLNMPTVNSDGTLFYSYIDVVDTTGGVNKYQLFTVYSKDNGATWSDPVQVLDAPDFNAEEFVDVAREADGDLHVVYCVRDTVGVDTINYYYQAVDIADLMGGKVISPLVVNEIMFDVTRDNAETPDVNEGDANGDGQRSPRGDEFIEFYNNGDAPLDISGYELLKRDLTVFFTFPANTVLQPGEFAVVFGGVSANGFGAYFPEELQMFAAHVGDGDAGFAGNDGTTNLQAGEDNVIVVNPAASDTIAEYYWGTATAKTSVGIKLAGENTVGGADLSGGEIRMAVTRNPDITGLWDLHLSASSAGLYHSPGTYADSVFFTSIGSDMGSGVPKEHALHQNYPNPFNPSTTIKFSLKQTIPVTLSIYNVTGQKVAALLDNQTLQAGEQEVVWQAEGNASGIYFYRLETGDNRVFTRKMILIK